MKGVLKERMPPEEMFTVIHHQRNRSDRLSQKNRSSQICTHAGQAKLACGSHFFVGLGVSCFLRWRGVKLWLELQTVFQMNSLHLYLLQSFMVV